MMRLKQKGGVPYGGLWVINRPDKQIIARGLLFNNVLDSSIRWRQANGIPVGLGFEDEVEQCCCEEKPDECINTDPNKPVARNMTVTDVIVGTQTMMNIMNSSDPLVAREEAERRARICIACPWNRWFAKPCGGICGTLKELVSKITNNVGTQYDSQLHACNVCRCFLQSSIWVKNELQWPVLTESEKAQFLSVERCWKRPPTDT
jgi:hypothetical protein